MSLFKKIFKAIGGVAGVLSNKASYLAKEIKEGVQDGYRGKRNKCDWCTQSLPSSKLIMYQGYALCSYCAEGMLSAESTMDLRNISKEKQYVIINAMLNDTNRQHNPGGFNVFIRASEEQLLKIFSKDYEESEKITDALFGKN